MHWMTGLWNKATELLNRISLLVRGHMSPSLTNSDRIRKHTPKGAPKFDRQSLEILQIEHVHRLGLLHAQGDSNQ
jgi:hypothetical protein